MYKTILVVVVVVILESSNNNLVEGKLSMDRAVRRPSPNYIYPKNNNLKSESSGQYNITEEPCFPLPTISILSYTRDGFEQKNEEISTELESWNRGDVASNGKIWIAPYAAMIELECQSSVPIEFVFDGPHEPEVMSIDVARQSQNSGNCFRIVVKLMTMKRSTGKYICRAINETYQNTWLYLYGEGNGPPFLLYNGQEFTIVQNESSSTVILPCQVVNPTTRPYLYKGDNQVLAIQGAVPYDPQVGFKLELGNISSPFDRYKCSLSGDSVSITVQRLPDFRVTPSSTDLTVVEGQSIRLVCEGTYPIGLQGFIEDRNVTIIENASERFYKYKVTYDLHLKPKDVNVGISCVNLQTNGTKLHTWHSKLIAAEVEKQDRIIYNSETQRFYCNSKSDKPPTIALVKCNSLLECKLADKCFGWDAPYKITSGNTCSSQNKIQRGRTCSDKDRLNPSSGCAYVQISNLKLSSSEQYSAGAVHCSLPDNGEMLKLYFFKGLHSDNVIFDSNQAAPEELIHINVQENRTFYTREKIKFTCDVQKFVFAEGQLLKFKLDDGSIVTPNGNLLIYNIRDPNETFKTSLKRDNSIVALNSTLELHDDRIREVVCMAPYWNQTNWMVHSIPIKVIASIPPTFIKQSEFLDSLHVVTGSNTSLKCEADGLPLPRIAWYKDGKRVENQIEETEFNGEKKMKLSTMHFNYVSPSDDGKYVCVLENVAGKQSKEVTLVVTQSRKTFYTALIIGLIAVIIFLTILTILYRKLRKNQALLRRLTEKEVAEFKFGDPNALRSVPEGYIRAQYLPYDKDYEIKQENLKIDEELLGQGEYGVVHKGMLRHNDSLKEVAVKTSRGPDINHFKALLTELKMLTYIGWHDNVINLLGAVTRNVRDRNVYVVVEYCRLGDLESYLHQNRSCFLNQIIDDKIDLNRNFSFNPLQPYQPAEYTMKTSDLINWSYQISSGMEYLANKKVIHGDLAARNILLTEDQTIKITDFGLSKHLYNGSNYISHAHISRDWRVSAPEILQYPCSYSTQSDVWAAGVAFWEIFTLGDTPYSEIPYGWNFRGQLLHGYRLAKPAFANQDIYNQILKCWKNVSAERITFEELRKYFHRILHHWAETDSSEDLSSTPSPLLSVEVTPQVTILPDHRQDLLGNPYVTNPTNQQRVHYTTTAMA